jgi:indole-3-glycerol phosphate synthase
MDQILEAVEKANPVKDAVVALKGDKIRVIAEVKRSSPSKGQLAQILDPAELAKSYEAAGASAVSVLTESRRFGGSLKDLDVVRSAVNVPVLRKDFMVDEYQFYEARAHGADIILLIVAALSKNQLHDFADLTKSLGMHALIEVHTEDELIRALEISPSIVGVNSRNLKTLEVDPQVFSSLIPQIPENIIRVAESGISSADDVGFAKKCGANAVLVGETLVKGSDVALTMRTLLAQG